VLRALGSLDKIHTDRTHAFPVIWFATSHSVASRPVSVRSIICSEKRRLGDLLLEAVREKMALYDRELKKLLSGGAGFDRLGLALVVGPLLSRDEGGLCLAHGTPWMLDWTK